MAKQPKSFQNSFGALYRLCQWKG